MLFLSHIRIELIFMPLALQLIGLMFAVLSDPYISKKLRRLTLVIIALMSSLIIQNYLDYQMSLGDVRYNARVAVSVYGYIVRPILIALLFYITREDRHHWVTWTLIGVNSIIYLSAFFSDYAFYITPENSFQRGPLGYSCHIVSGILLLYSLVLAFREFSDVRKLEAWIPVFNVISIIGSVILELFTNENNPVSWLTIAVVNSSVFYYIWIHLQFVREHERDLMAEQRIQIMLSQIKPHFLYNALGSIEALCTIDPLTAKQATVKFSRYLRGNMESIAAEGLIPFEKELEHTQLYLDLEQLRFGDELQVQYEISCRDFFIPSLTLEPLAENAVRHGVRGREDGRGTVTISTREFSDRYEIAVSDNGPGFDPSAPIADGRTHIGIQNVTDRLWKICGGRLEISSSAQKGTRAVIILPKD